MTWELALFHWVGWITVMLVALAIIVFILSLAFNFWLFRKYPRTVLYRAIEIAQAEMAKSPTRKKDTSYPRDIS
jgi:hypothetical protein